MQQSTVPLKKKVAESQVLILNARHRGKRRAAARLLNFQSSRPIEANQSGEMLMFAASKIPEIRRREKLGRSQSYWNGPIAVAESRFPSGFTRLDIYVLRKTLRKPAKSRAIPIGTSISNVQDFHLRICDISGIGYP